MNDDAWLDLHDMLQSWKARNKVDIVQPQYRPIFRGKRRNSGIHVNDDHTPACGEESETRPSPHRWLSVAAVEFLLWQYIGSPADVLEPLRVDMDSHAPARQD